MEWEANDRDAWVADAERWIGQIKGVRQCKIELDSQGEVSGVHVVAGCDREPRHIVRDVESLLKARLGLDVYYKKIGVVQVLDSAPAPPDAAAASSSVTPPAAGAGGRLPSGVAFFPPGHPDLAEWEDAAQDERTPAAQDLHVDEDASGAAGPQPRPRPPAAAPQGEPAAPIPAVLVGVDAAVRVVCGGVGVLVSERLIRAEVVLRAGEVQARGVQEGPNHPQADLALIARATLAAAAGLLAEDLLLHLQEIRTVPIAGRSVILAAVNLVEGRRSEILLGCCDDAHNRQQAAVHAVLGALNRRLGQYPLKEAKAEA